MYKNILLDLDDTIFDFHKAEHIALEKTLIKLGINPQKEILDRYSEINKSQWELLELGKLDREEVKVRRYKLLFEELGLNISDVLAARTYEKILSEGHYYIDGAEELLKEIYIKYNLYLVSNGSTHIQKSRIKSSNIEEYLDGIFISEDIGYNKPDVRFFEKCFEKIGNIKKEETIIVGDSLTSDITGGINAGIKTIWFNPKFLTNNCEIKPDYEVNELRDVINIIDAE